MGDTSGAKDEKSTTAEMFPLNIKIKQEKTTSYEDSSKSETVDKLSIDLNLSNIFTSARTSNPSTGSAAENQNDTDQAKESKSIEPLKSSNEILTELFKVFNAAPPEIIDDDSNEADLKKKKRKHKKKSKKKKKSEGGSESSSDTAAEEGEILKKVKKIKKEKTKEKHKNKKPKKDKVKREKNKVKEKETHNNNVVVKSEMSSVVVKREFSNDRYSRDSADYRDSREYHQHHSGHHHSSSLREDHHQARIKQEKVDHSYREYDKERVRERDKEREDPKSHRIQIKSLKDSAIFKEAATKEKEREKDRVREKERDKDRYREHSDLREMRRRRSDSDFSISDEEPYRQGRYYDFYSKKYNSFYASYKDEEYQRNRKRKRSEDRERYRKSKSRSRSPQFDKQKLLEIARKNAISMLKKGTLPGAQGLDKESKEKLILKMKTTGKTVEELTEYCKKISEKESLNDLSSVSEDSDHDVDGSSKAFHHPFQIKDPGPIVMNIKNAVPLPPKSAEQTKALLLQYPVSSGAQHRKMESEWVPVQKPPTAAPVAIVRPEKPIPKILPTSASFVQSVEQQQPAYTAVNPVPGPQVFPPVATDPQPVLPSDPAPTTASLPVPLTVDPSVAPPAINLPTFPPPAAALEPPQMEVFPTNQEAMKLDVSSIISQRLNAMRKLQDNPADAEAIKLLYNTQKDMSAWASSKFTPGQFLGSTGVQCLSQRELAEGYQPWAKRDSLKQTAPVSGGMGMHLLQKMGWVPGEGLGKEKNGSLEPLLLDVKLDKRGLVASAEDHQRQIQMQIQQQHSGRRARFTNVKIVTDGKHPVSILGEYCSKRKWLPPRYDLVHESGPGHAKNFVFKVIVNGLEYQPAITNNTKKEAKATAAKFCLQQLGILQS
ncbi:protein Son [Sabethes cyaneus]|uniref:protein Son n=1 Tax=Sabethes cyaneus TaxID=53552 RepID=UPI00237DD6C6|nr:protein Son [Sabethes cyaneus]